MQVKKYAFGGCKIEITSDFDIVPEGHYSKFLADFDVPDYSVRVVTVDELPEKEGNCVYDNDNGSLYVGEFTRKYKTFIDMTIKGYADFSCLENDEILYIKHPDEISEFVVFESLDLPHLLLQKGIGILHCSFIEYEGEAILFAGDKQVGKSTQAGLWSEHKGARVLNGDRAGVFLEDGKVYATGVPYCGTSGICFNEKTPVKAIVALSKGDENVLSTPSFLESVLFTIGRFTYSYWEESASDMAFSVAENICENVCFLSYSCLKDGSAVELLCNKLKEI